MPFLFLRPAKFFTSAFSFGSKFCKLIVHLALGISFYALLGSSKKGLLPVGRGAGSQGAATMQARRRRGGLVPGGGP